jgi:GTP-binding protein
VIALNKLDLIDSELAEALGAELEEESGARVIAVSGATGAGVDRVLDAILERLGRLDDDREEESDWSPL